MYDSNTGQYLHLHVDGVWHVASFSDDSDKARRVLMGLVGDRALVWVTL